MGNAVASPTQADGPVRRDGPADPPEEPVETFEPIGPHLRPPDPPLSDGAIAVRRLLPEDAEAIRDACQDPEIARRIPITIPYTLESAIAFIEESETGWTEGREATFAILDAATGRFVGAASLQGSPGGNVTFGCWVAAKARGRGVGTRTARLLARWAFASLPIERLEIMTEPDNVPPQRLAEKAGFVREGLLRRYVEAEGGRVDVVMFSLLRDEASATLGEEIPDHT